MDQRASEVTDERDAFFEMSGDLLGVARLDGYFKRLNPAWTEALGWSIEELCAEPWLAFVHPEDREATLAAGGALAAGTSIAHFFNRYRCKDGAYRWLEWRCVPSVRRGLIYAVARDVTEQREAREVKDRVQQQLVVAERMASVGTLAAGVAHEINNPLDVASVPASSTAAFALG